MYTYIFDIPKPSLKLCICMLMLNTPLKQSQF